MASDGWARTCTQVERQYRKRREEMLSVQRVRVRTAIDRWLQEAVQPTLQYGEKPAGWWERACDTIPLLQLRLVDVVPPRLRATLAQDLRAAVDEVHAHQRRMAGPAPSMALYVVAPAVLSLAASIGVVRGMVFVLDYFGVSLHSVWWVLATVTVGLMFMGIVVLVRYRQRAERQQALLLNGVRGEMNRRVEELMAQWFFAANPFDTPRDSVPAATSFTSLVGGAAALPTDMRETEDSSPSPLPRRIILALELRRPSIGAAAVSRPHSAGASYLTAGATPSPYPTAGVTSAPPSDFRKKVERYE